jgi:hypothetical protein
MIIDVRIILALDLHNPFLSSGSTNALWMCPSPYPEMQLNLVVWMVRSSI